MWLGLGSVDELVSPKSQLYAVMLPEVLMEVKFTGLAWQMFWEEKLMSGAVLDETVTC